MPLTETGVSGLARGLSVSLLLWLSGCIGWGVDLDAAAKPGSHLGADFSNAVSRNAVRHIIDLSPIGSATGPPGMDGMRAAQALDRYQHGAVTPLEAVETSTFGEAR